MAAKGNGMVYVEAGSVHKLQAVQRALKDADKQLRKDLNAELRQAVRPLLEDLKHSAEGINFVSTAGKQPSRHARRNARTLKSGKVKLGRSLRKDMAFGLKTKISTGTQAGIRIKMDSRTPDVNNIARKINATGGVRHPLFGNRNDWYETRTTNGKGWFTDTADRQLPLVRKRIEAILDHWIAKTAAKIDRAA